MERKKGTGRICIPRRSEEMGANEISDGGVIGFGEEVVGVGEVVTSARSMLRSFECAEFFYNIG